MDCGPCVMEKMERFGNTGLTGNDRGVNSLVCMLAPLMACFALIQQGNKKAGVSQDVRRLCREFHQSHLPLPCLSTRHFFPKPSICFLLVAKSPGPKLTQPMPISRGRDLGFCCSATFRREFRTASDGVQPLSRTSCFSAASASLSNRTCTVAPIFLL